MRAFHESAYGSDSVSDLMTELAQSVSAVRRRGEEEEEKYLERVREKEKAIKKKEKMVSKMEREEMKLIQKLKNTQQLQQRAFYELDNALNASHI